jgi:hypothetical protein
VSEQESVAELLRKGINAAQANRREEARGYLLQVVERDEWNERAWLWLSGVVDEPVDMQVALANALTINPENEHARRGLEALHERYGDLLPAEEKAPAAVPAADEADDEHSLNCYSCGAQIYDVAHFCWQCHAVVHCCANCTNHRDTECKEQQGIRGPAATFTLNDCPDWTPP